jgi:hypothetical protein
LPPCPAIPGDAARSRGRSAKHRESGEKSGVKALEKGEIAQKIRIFTSFHLIA